MAGGVILNAQQLASRLSPAKTVLLLGAGASIESGGMPSAELARSMSLKLAGEVVSDDLMEASTILQNRYGRNAVVKEVVDRVRPLQPAGGLLVLPEFPWSAIYTTNYDLLVERGYRRLSRPLTVVRSNHEWGLLEAGDGPPLFKIHGCVSGDAIVDKSQLLVLTEPDYEAFEEFREVIYRRLALDLLTKDVVVVGHSLRDPHLRKEIDNAARLRANQSLPGRIYVLAYSEDRDRAAIIQNKGIQVAFGGLDELLDALASEAVEDEAATPASDSGAAFLLPVRLRTPTTEIAHARTLEPNSSRLYHGGAASYADISAGLTIQRSNEVGLVDRLRDRSAYAISIVGVAGVGKSTLARRVVEGLHETVDVAYEHRNEFPFRARDWIEVEGQLELQNLRGILLVDDCPPHLSQLNRLVDALNAKATPALQVIVTAERAHWVGRVKSPGFFNRGHIEDVSRLSEFDINELVNLLDREPRIRELVDRTFTNKPRRQQVRALQSRCASDMFVCLKNIFASDDLDAILLREYARLDVELQEIYRYVCAIESLGPRVHRQMIIRLLNVDVDTLATTLARLEGLVDEYDIAPRDGIYGLSARHIVIARIIIKYKFSDASEHEALLRAVIDNLNPSVSLELRTVRDLCNSDYGISSVPDVQARLDLYQRLIDLAPGERIPRHRLIRTLIESGDLTAAADAIREAEESAGLDPPIASYRVRLEVERATRTEGILAEDRKAILRQALILARKNIGRFPNDMHAVVTFGRVAVQLVERGEPIDLVDEAIAMAVEAEERLLDPKLGEEIGRLQRTRQRLVKSPLTPSVEEALSEAAVLEDIEG